MMSTLALAAVATVGLAILRAATISLIAGEIKGALAAYLEVRVRNAALKLGPELASDQEQEWLEELKVLADRPVRAVLFTHGLSRAARAIAAESGLETQSDDATKPDGTDTADIDPSAPMPTDLQGARVPAPAPAVVADGLASMLRQRGMRVTPQRMIVHRALRELNRHVTADELMDAVGDRLPNMSLPTLYATLELFEELGMVRRVQRVGTTLFDPRLDPHHHLVCTRCGAIEDLDSILDSVQLESAAALRGFEYERVDAQVHGCCARCQADAG
jgi:Fe2+ or Zn2+ uptake regulation protein